ncbi:hypothetical protein, partial [Pseudoalteromonas sp. SR43-7]|uniref:hypothetical protein n=1 Tax=Pseudoalteromonas sp. SR43-7 TaxID=2760939 RepID=UPI001C720222
CSYLSFQLDERIEDIPDGLSQNHLSIPIKRKMPVSLTDWHYALGILFYYLLSNFLFITRHTFTSS